MHAPSRSSYDPGEKLTVTGLSAGQPSAAAGPLREKVNHGLNRLLNKQLSRLFKDTRCNKWKFNQLLILEGYNIDLQNEKWAL